MIQSHQGHLHSRTSVVLLHVTFVLVAAIYYLFLLTDGRIDLVNPIELSARGLVFNSMMEHLRHGRFDVDPAATGWEGCVRDGKAYIYFGIVPALLRFPLLLSDGLARLEAIAFFAIVLSLLFGGGQIQFLKGSIFQETILWAGAIAAAFVYCAVRGLIVKREFPTGLSAAMAGLAGLALLTRVSTAGTLRCHRVAGPASRLANGRTASPPLAPVRPRLGEQAYRCRARDLSSVRDIVRHGKLSAMGRPAEVFRPPRLHHLYGRG